MIGSDKTPAYIRGAFTLVEVLIVVAILGILGAMVVPLVSSNLLLAKEAAVRSDLRSVRIAIGRFAAEHNGKLPWSISDGRFAAGSGGSFRNHLRKYSNADGEVSKDKDINYPYGPYLSKFPLGLIGLGKGEDRILMRNDGLPLSFDGYPARPWKYDYTTGEFIFNSGEMSSDGVTRYDEY